MIINYHLYHHHICYYSNLLLVAPILQHAFVFQTEMTTAEMELDQNTNFDWNRIQESGQDTEPLCGPGYTGLVNLGNRYFVPSNRLFYNK